MRLKSIQSTSFVLEVIRLYEPDVYRALRSNKELLTINGRPDKPQSEVASRAINEILQLGSEQRREQLRKLLRHLFPGIQWAMGGTEYASEFETEWYRERRVCSSKMFDRYFRFAVSDDEMSQAEVSKLLQARGSRSNLRTELESLHTKGLLKLSIDELAIHEDEIEAQQVEAYITALFDVADQLSDEKKGMMEVPASWRVGFLVRNAIAKSTPLSQRLTLVANAVTQTDGLFAPVDFIALLGAPSQDTSEKTFSTSPS